MESQPQILVAVYDDGLLITIDGRSVFRQMTSKQMFEMAQELIARGLHNQRRETYGART